MGRGARRRPRHLAAKLLQIRDRLFGGLSQGELIELLGLTDYINRGEISDFERGVREPDLLTLKAYADGAGISVDDLIDDDVKLPRKLPAAGHTKGSGLKPQKIQTEAKMSETAVTLRLQIESDDHVARQEARVRGNIEKAHLKRHRMKKLKDGEYELTVFHQDDADLDEHIYALLGAIKREARRGKCSVNVDVREKGTDRYW